MNKTAKKRTGPLSIAIFSVIFLLIMGGVCVAGWYYNLKYPESNNFFQWLGTEGYVVSIVLTVGGTFLGVVIAFIFDNTLDEKHENEKAIKAYEALIDDLVDLGKKYEDEVQPLIVNEIESCLQYWDGLCHSDLMTTIKGHWAYNAIAPIYAWLKYLVAYIRSDKSLTLGYIKSAIENDNATEHYKKLLIELKKENQNQLLELKKILHKKDKNGDYANQLKTNPLLKIKKVDDKYESEISKWDFL